MNHPNHPHATAPSRGSDHMLTAIFAMLALMIALNIFAIYFLMGNTLNLGGDTSTDALGIKKAILAVEYDKVGGKENYDLINQATQIQLKEQLPQMKEYIEKSGGETGAANTEKVITSEDAAKIRENIVIEGNVNADILVIEYSDMECPFCMKQFHETKLPEQLIAQYGDKVAFAFKNSRGVNHPGTEAKAIATLCAQKVGGNEAYIKFYKAIMSGSTNEGGVYDVAKLPEISTQIGLDASAWQTCFDQKETAGIFAAQSAEAEKYGLSGTPGTLIYHTKTGKYDTISGAYPYTEFTNKIDTLSK